MEAMRLIEASRRALAAAEGATEAMVEVWQAQALAQAVGSRLAVAGPPELRGEALGLTELTGRGCGVLGRPDLDAGSLRAARLTDVSDVRESLRCLRELLGEVGMALVGLACAAADESTYWQCMEAIDAADEARDRVLEMLRRLATREDAPHDGRGRLARQGDGTGEGDEAEKSDRVTGGAGGIGGIGGTVRAGEAGAGEREGVGEGAGGEVNRGEVRPAGSRS